MKQVELSVGGRSHRAFYAEPDGDGPFPAVVVIHDLTGMREDTRRHVQRFADAGYAAIAPDLFMGSMGCIVRTFATMVRERGAALDVIEAARAWLVGSGAVDPERVSVTGFCMGGGFALLAGADGHYAVAAPFYGPVPFAQRRLEGLCPTIGQFGARDLVFRSHASRLSRHLEALGVPHEVLVHDGVGHSFMNDHPDALFALGRFTPLRAAHDARVEAVAWDRMLAFLRVHDGPPA